MERDCSANENKSLFKFQQDTVNILLSSPDKHIVYATMGVGKTAISVVWAQAKCLSRGLSKVLVITTASKSKTCFPKGVKIATPNGEKNIEDIKVGDKVLSYDGHDVVEQIVVDTIVKNRDKRLYRIDFCGGRHIVGTEDHPFYIGNGEYKEMGQLKPGEKIYGFRSKTERITTQTPNSNGKILPSQSEPCVLSVQDSNTDSNKSTTRPMVEKKNVDMLRGVCEGSKKNRQEDCVQRENGKELSKGDILSGMQKANTLRRYEKQ